MKTETETVPQAPVAEYRKGEFLISTDPSKLDVDSIHRFLSTSYWETEGMRRETLERSIRGSLCFGIYDAQRQVGFARVVTDGATFAYLCDDYVAESHRGRGLGKWLMQCIFSHPDLQDLHRWVVVTHDTRLYEKVGFVPLKEPGTYLEIVRPFAGQPQANGAP
jgi:GNAT superfamily N-acetyltransferase